MHFKVSNPKAFAASKFFILGQAAISQGLASYSKQ